MAITFLAIAVSIIAFINKVLLLLGKRSGWFLGILAGVLFIFYFYLNDVFVLTAYAIGFTVLMTYGYVSTEKKLKIEKTINYIIIVVLIILTIFTFSGTITILELVVSISGLGGTYLLSHNKERLGWVCFLIAHAAGAYIFYTKGQIFYADFQVAAGVVSLIGIMLDKNTNLVDHL